MHRAHILALILLQRIREPIFAIPAAMGGAWAVMASRASHAVQWVRAVVFFAGAMACASIHRVTFSVLAIPIREEFALSLPQMGILQSAVLAGYIIGQVNTSV